ncbi:hypothetical protein WH50_15215 [Pokkaliibacter plantistimulans]|uniref:HMA domain-containing protein n=1 Tax=Pokkaliibacter plantistimulans TaxID=1635171 RepID=A0ABX5LV13_9GAMM|nr:heavy metal translocating P-type ATPase [Pokkaliibacter plantistimulans]PXF30492.1 hypothetical protein WH50_15215 [Pokkaliibacter plantistimulans]
MPHSCFHCGQPLPADTTWFVTVGGEPKPMCCPGCQAVCQTIMDAGLGDYYQHRQQGNLPADLAPQSLTSELSDELQLFDQQALQQDFVEDTGQGHKRAVFIVEGITCAACIWLLEHSLRKIPGVKQATVNLTTHRATLEWHPDQVLISHLLGTFYRLGYKAYPYQPDAEEARNIKESRSALFRLGVAGIGMMQVMMYAVALYAGALQGMETKQAQYLRLISLIITTPIVFYSAQPFFIAAWRDLRSRHLTMDLPVSLAIGIAYLASLWSTFAGGGAVYFDSITMFTFLLLLGRFVEMRARHRMGKSGNQLSSILPTSAVRLNSEGEQRVAARDLLAGDRILVKPGQLIPADGMVESGHSTVDEAIITGESVAIVKAPGSQVLGGAMNVTSPLTIRVQKVAQSTRASAIAFLLERAFADKPRTAIIADRVASRFVLAVLIVSALVAIVWSVIDPADAFWVTLSVLVITCPCALSLATPTALTAATTALRQRGFLITRGHVLESLASITHVVFDKTGTLTEGKLVLHTTQPLTTMSAADCRVIVAALEQGSEHPIAHAFKPYQEKAADNLQNHVAQGVEGSIAGTVYRFGKADFAAEKLATTPASPSEHGQWLLLCDEYQPLAWFQLTDALRPEAHEVVSQLLQRGIHVSLLSGDQPAPVAAVAAQLNISNWFAGVSPEQKLEKITALQAAGEQVLMVGDGINDVLVLAQAQTSVAMNQATDLAKTSADSMLLRADLRLLLQAMEVAQQTRRIIWQNIGWAIGYNLLALPLAASGMIPPYLAAVGMASSSLIVVCNAMRLGRDKRLTTPNSPSLSTQPA